MNVNVSDADLRGALREAGMHFVDTLRRANQKCDEHADHLACQVEPGDTGFMLLVTAPNGVLQATVYQSEQAPPEVDDEKHRFMNNQRTFVLKQIGESKKLIADKT